MADLRMTKTSVGKWNSDNMVNKTWIKSGTIIVLNYNGARLLQKYLANVVETTHHTKVSTRVVVADNGSTDDSQKVVASVTGAEWLTLGQNYGFGDGNNRAVAQIKCDVVILLNSDVDPDKYFLDPLYDALSNEDIFAASSRQLIHGRAKSYYSGGTVGEWSAGLLRHRPLEEMYPKPLKNVPTFYPDGGASAYNREKYMEIGGFSPIYQPFYWEDADLGMRGWHRAWQSLYVPNSQVDHFHETTISKMVSRSTKQAIGWQGIFLFTWSNIDSLSMLLTHLFWLPLHILNALLTGRLFRIYGLYLALTKLNMLSRSHHHKLSTAQIIALTNK